MIENRPNKLNEMLDGVERYNPENLPELETYLAEQCRTQSYDLLANLALLELYQFNPNLINLEVVTTVLSLALIKLPENDFTMYSSLLLPGLLKEEKVKALIDVFHHLEEASFLPMWEILTSELVKEGSKEVLHFDKQIRQVIVNIISLTFQSIELNLLGTYLNLKDDELKSFLDTLDWKIDGEHVIIPSTKHTEVKVNQPYNIKLDTLSKVLAL